MRTTLGRLGIAALPLAGCLIALAVLPYGGHAEPPVSTAPAAPAAAPPASPLPSLAPMLTRVTPAVVNISSTTHVRVRDPFFDDPFFRRFFGVPDTPRERVEQSLGSGVIVDAGKGYVLTNNHVIAGADDITVTLQDGRNFKAKVVGADPDTDVAVVQIPAQNLRALPLADSSQLRVGDYVVAVGDPFGLGQTVTSGIVSALGRSGLGDNSYQNFIQTDASINPGNSGGALVNLRGELVGVNTMIYSPSGGNVGIGFAIPSNLAGEVMQQLVRYGTVKRGSLGIDTQALTPRIARALGVEASAGAVVTRVDEGSAGDRAGLKPGDVITAVDGHPVRTPQDLRNAEGLAPVGSVLKLGVLRDGTPLVVGAKVEPERLASADGGRIDPRLAGATLADIPQRLRQQGLYGVQVTALSADSRAAAAGLQQGDVVVGVNQRPLADLRALRDALGQHPRQLMLAVVRGDNLLYLLIE
ncbi:periplasmic serine protease, Do/DeqQ family [Mizugakiibacter sediminis]|uniref:Periplasmic serine protease, Do/DeqQ family n=1 Tax=Mizugakiibacter sediminis TaxID=1475481 RepID=A0A0K8QNB1_9GAMM|nr:periplasmic serine protease, Do/DeqQ family [Mizugakiibacter sediminis]